VTSGAVVVFSKSGETDVQRSSDTMADASESQAVGRTTRAGQDLTAAERSAVAEAMAALEAHTHNPRIEALHSKLNAARNPLDISGDADADDRVAKRAAKLANITKAEWDAADAGELSTEDHMRTSAAVRKAQLGYLASMGSGAGRVREHEAERERIAKASRGGRAA
jgi:hypothetical protein